jgi:hypothetical protein
MKATYWKMLVSRHFQRASYPDTLALLEFRDREKTP